MKKALIVIPIVVVIVAAAVYGLFAAGILGGKTDEPVAYAVDAESTETGVFKELSTDTFFDIRASREPTTGTMDNFVVVHDNKGNKVSLKSTRLGNGVYRITSRDGFKPRASYQIWATGATFVAEQYKDLDTFIFMTKGAEAEKVEVKKDIKETEIDGTVVQPIEQNGVTNYKITLAAAAEERYKKGDVILAKKPSQTLFDGDLGVLYSGDVEGFAYNGMAAYYVLDESEVEDGREVVFCRFAEVSEVVSEIDINKTLPIDEKNFSVNEELLQEALEKSEFTAAVYEAAVEAFDMISGKLEKTVKDSPKMVAKFTWDVNMDKIQLNFYFTITLTKGVEVVFAVKNTIDLTPNLNWQYNGGTDIQLDLGVNIKTKTVCSIDMQTSDAKLQATDMEDFKKKFTDLVTGKTAEKGGIVGAELPIYSYKYPIYCFVLGVEFGVDINLDLKAQINFEYIYNTDITVGVTYVNGEINSYKSVDTSSTAKDLVMLGKIKAEAGVYVKLTASLLEVAGVGFKVKAGAYAEIAGQLRLDMQAAIKDKNLKVFKGYYVTGGLYLGFDFQLKAGLDLPVVGYTGWDKTWELARLEYPLFEFGSRYLIESLVNTDITMQVQGKTAALDKIKVKAFDLEKVSAANQVEVTIDSFDIEYLDDAKDYITIENGLVKVNPTVGTEFTAIVQITAKNDSSVVGTISFHKAAVMPTCAETELVFDKDAPANVTFSVSKNQSTFISLNGYDIAAANYVVSDTGVISISKEYLSGLAVGEYTFVYVTDKGRLYLTVNVVDSTPISAAVTSKTFSKGSMANVIFSLDLAGNKVNEIKGLEKGEYSVDSAGTLVIYALALKEKAVGDYNYKVIASNGTELTVNVSVEDDRLPALYEKEFNYAKNSGIQNGLNVAFESYEYRAVAVSGNGITADDYVLDDSSVTIGKAYLARLDLRYYDFTISFEGKTGTENRTFRVKVIDNAVIIGGSTVATFDKYQPSDAEYAVYASAAVTLAGDRKMISASDYIVSGSVVKIKQTYLATLSVGTYTYYAKAGSDKIELTLNVIDTTPPKFKSSQGGVFTLNYDKAKSNENRAFELLLGGAEFTKLDGNRAVADRDYVVKVQGDTTTITLQESYLNALRVGTYEFNVMTSVNASTLIVKITDTRSIKADSDTSISYSLGSATDKVITFKNYEHDIKSIVVKRGADFSLFDGDGDFDPATGVLTLKAKYLETLTQNDYATLILTFDDAAATVMEVTIAVS